MNKTPYIGFWKRALAFVIDGILASVPPAVICLPLILWQVSKITQTEGTEQALGHIAAVGGIYILWQILGLVCFWLYFAWLESGPKQATFGKRIMGIKVVDYKGERLGFGRATGRTFAKLLSYTLMYIGFIMAGMTNRKRALHDYIAQTYVVRKDFQTGDDLPDTPAHPVCLGIASTLLVLGMAAIILFSIANAAPAITANTAAQRLQAFAADPQLLREPAELNGVSYLRTREGLEARFEANGDEYRLVLPRAGEAVCCDGFACENTPFEECY